MNLPPLREELALLPGPPLADGQPSHTLHDPVRNQFFQLDWPTFEVLRHWHLGDVEQITQVINEETTLHLDAEDVLAVAGFLDENQLLQAQPGKAAEFAERVKLRRGSIGDRLLHNYLFFRVPLVKPDRLLGKWSAHLGWFYTRQFWSLTLAALILGLVVVYRDWDRFTTTLVDTLTWSGFISYGLALIVVKVLHELGHAVTAKRLGCRVPTMGVAFLVLWPVAYTDTNEVWRLTSRRDRLLVVAAGILSELTVAAWATLAWVFLPEGTPKSIAFLLATTTWVASIAINASPFMRFDGYFLLSDWLEMPNLHTRAFALARWDMRERLFALGETVPEVLPARRHALLIVFAYVTWIYRLVIFLGIAALVYTFFIKAVGIFLFLVEICWFVLLPFYREFQAWRIRWPALKVSRRARRSAVIASVLVALLVVPLPNHLSSIGMLRPVDHFILYAPQHARVERMPLADGARVQAGEVLIELAAPDLLQRKGLLEAKRSRLQWQASAGTFDSEQRAQWQVLQEQLATTEAELSNLQAEADRYRPTAPFAGVLRDLDPELKPGVWLSQNEPLARVVADAPVQVVVYLDENDVGYIERGSSASFFPEGFGSARVALEVVSIDRDASRVLPEPELSSLYGGNVAVREKKGILYPDHAIYRVTLKANEVSEQLAGRSWRGHVVLSGHWTPLCLNLLRSALSVFWREAGF